MQHESDDPADILNRVRVQFSSRNTLQDPLSSVGPLPPDFLDPGMPHETILEAQVEGGETPGGLIRKKRAAGIHALLYRSSSIKPAIVVDVEASFSVNHLELREICAVNLLTGDELLHKTFETPISLNLISGKFSGITADGIRELKQLLESQLDQHSWIGHNIEYDFDVIDRIVSFVPGKPFEPQQMKIKLQRVDLIDTRHISWLINPCHKYHNLESLHSSLCETKTHSWHTASGDCSGTREVVLAFRDKYRPIAINKTNHLGHAIMSLDRRHPLKRILEIDLDRDPMIFQSNEVPFRDSVISRSGEETTRASQDLDTNRAIELLDQLLINNKIGSGSYPGQKTFVTRAVAGFQSRKRIAIESGTGTGKTYAYLASVIEGIRCGKKAVVATPTLNLQKQVWDSAMEFRSQLEDTKFNLRVAQVIGAANFFSVQQIYNLSRTKSFGHPAESFLSAYLQLRLYSFKSNHSHETEPDRYIQDYLNLGNSSEIPGGLKKMIRTAGLSLARYLCRPNEKVRSRGLGRIHFPKISYLQQSDSDLLIENQSLFFRKRLLENKPEETSDRRQELIVIDEAHGILHEGTSALTQTLSCLDFALDISETADLTKVPLPDSAANIRVELQEHLHPLLPSLRRKTGQLLINLRRVLNNHGNSPQDDFLESHDELLPVNSVSYLHIPLEDQHGWPELIAQLEQLLEAILKLRSSLKKSRDDIGLLLEKLSSGSSSSVTDVHPSAGFVPTQETNVESRIADFFDLIERSLEGWSEQQDVCQRILEFSKSYSRDGNFRNDWVLSIREEEPPCPLEIKAGEVPYKWATLEGPDKIPVVLWQAQVGIKPPQFPVRLELAPLWPGAMLQNIWDQADAAIFTSGTLRIGGRFESWKEWSGFGKPEGSEEDSRYLIETPIPGLDPMAKMKVWRNYSLSFDAHADQKLQNENIAREVSRANLALGSGTLTLFTSRDALGKTAEILRTSGHAQEKGLEILAQEPGGVSRMELTDRFKERNNRSILLGTRSFWEGIDLPGSIRHLVIPRLPFSNIGDPLVEARMKSCEMGENPESGFDKFLLPQMLQQLRQGLGRGIRKESDRCTVHILDSRAIWSSYTDQIDQLLKPETNEIETGENHLQYSGLSKAESYLLGEADMAEADANDKWSTAPGPVRFGRESEHIQQLRELAQCEDFESRLELGFQSFSGAKEKDGEIKPWPHQTDAIRQMIENRDSGEVIAVIRATGGGKSAIYKTVAGLERQHGITLVISPLISLMTDQAQQQRPGSEGIRSLDSLMHASRRSAICAEIVDSGQAIHLLLTAPERLSDPELFSVLLDRGVARIVVDEGHLLGNWGNDFRPLYRRIPKVIQSLEAKTGRSIPVTLFSATFRKQDFADLEMILGRSIVQNWDPNPDPAYRPNLVPEIISASVDLPTNKNTRRLWQLEQLKDQLRQVLDPNSSRKVLIFVRKKVDAVLWALALRNILPEFENEILPYFSDIPERMLIDRKFNEQGSLKVLVTTSAFGMGIDNHEIHAVYHLELPDSLTNYVQECGRAGRHPEPRVPGKHVLLFPGPADPQHSLHKSALNAISKSAIRLTSYVEEQWNDFLESRHPIVDVSTLVDPQDDPSHYRRWLVRAEELGLGTYLGHIPRLLRLKPPFPDQSGDLLKQEKNRFEWRDGVDPERAWEFMLEYRRGIRKRLFPIPTGVGSPDPLIAWASLGGSPDLDDFIPDPAASESPGEMLFSGRCLREALYTPFCREDSPPPHCQGEDPAYLCTVCKSRTEDPDFIDSNPDQRNRANGKWVTLANQFFKLRTTPEKVEIINFISTVSFRKCLPYLKQPEYEKMLNHWLFENVDFGDNS